MNLSNRTKFSIVTLLIALASPIATEASSMTPTQSRRLKMIGFMAVVNCNVRAGNYSKQKGKDMIISKFDSRDRYFFDRPEIVDVTWDMGSFLLINGKRNCTARKASDVRHFVPRIMSLF